MGGFYDDAKDIALHQWPILVDLFRSYLKLNGKRFLMQSETPPSVRLRTTLSLIVIHLAVVASFVLLNPLNDNMTLWALGRSGVQYVLLFLVSCLPLYLIMRPGTGIPSLHFFVNLQLVAGSVAVGVMCPIIVIGLLLSPNLEMDLRASAEGHGRGTAVFITYCGNLEAKRDWLLMQTELNAMTKEYDQPFWNSGFFDSEAEQKQQRLAYIRYLWDQHDREQLLPPEKQRRIKDLREAIPAKFQETLPKLELAQSEYPYFFYTLLSAQIFVPITSILSYIMIWRVFAPPPRRRSGRAVMTGRLLLAIIASVAFFLWFFNAASNRSFQTHLGIAESRRMLREEAQNLAFCRVDPKGLW